MKNKKAKPNKIQTHYNTIVNKVLEHNGVPYKNSQIKNGITILKFCNLIEDIKKTKEKDVIISIKDTEFTQNILMSSLLKQLNNIQDLSLNDQEVLFNITLSTLTLNKSYQKIKMTKEDFIKEATISMYKYNSNIELAENIKIVKKNINYSYMKQIETFSKNDLDKLNIKFLEIFLPKQYRKWNLKLLNEYQQVDISKIKPNANIVNQIKSDQENKNNIIKKGIISKTMSINEYCKTMKSFQVKIPPYQRNFKWDPSISIQYLSDIATKDLINIGTITYSCNLDTNVYEIANGLQRTIDTFLKIKALKDNIDTKIINDKLLTNDERSNLLAISYHLKEEYLNDNGLSNFFKIINFKEYKPLINLLKYDTDKLPIDVIESYFYKIYKVNKIQIFNKYSSYFDLLKIYENLLYNTVLTLNFNSIESGATIFNNLNGTPKSKILPFELLNGILSSKFEDKSYLIEDYENFKIMLLSSLKSEKDQKQFIALIYKIYGDNQSFTNIIENMLTSTKYDNLIDFIEDLQEFLILLLTYILLTKEDPKIESLIKYCNIPKKQKKELRSIISIIKGVNNQVYNNMFVYYIAFEYFIKNNITTKELWEYIKTILDISTLTFINNSEETQSPIFNINYHSIKSPYDLKNKFAKTKKLNNLFEIDKREFKTKIIENNAIYSPNKNDRAIKTDVIPLLTKKIDKSLTILQPTNIEKILPSTIEISSDHVKASKLLEEIGFPKEVINCIGNRITLDTNANSKKGISNDYQFITEIYLSHRVEGVNHIYIDYLLNEIGLENFLNNPFESIEKLANFKIEVLYDYIQNLKEDYYHKN